MEKKYQVFVSSTYQDLIEERQKVIEALLGKNCFPIGMEYFPAANDDQFTVIKKLIDRCDYYILIIGGRYGSIEPTSGKSYTQLEFEYALNEGIPVASFYHAEPTKLIGDKIEATDEGKRKLAKFKEIVQTKLCDTWKEPYELAFKVNKSLDYLFENNPRVGWVKANEVSSAEANKEIISLIKENNELLSRVKELEVSVPENLDELEQGDEQFSIRYKIYDSNSDEYSEFKIEKTWNNIFLLLASELLTVRSIGSIGSILHFKLNLPNEASVNEEDIETIIIQLISLGLVTSNVLDSGSFDCKLSAHGKNEMFRLRVRKKK